jgi:hypothetical protein
MPQCKAKTKTGARCLRTVKTGQTYCAQHRNKQSQRQAKSSSSRSKSSQKRGCKSQSAKKYTGRNSPPYPANECCGKTMMGNDGNKYKSVRASNGVCRWICLRLDKTKKN